MSNTSPPVAQVYLKNELFIPRPVSYVLYWSIVQVKGVGVTQLVVLSLSNFSEAEATPGR